jgi:hypothetical protein
MAQQTIRDWWEREPKDGFWFRCLNRFSTSLLKPSIPSTSEAIHGRAQKPKRGGGSAISARAMQRGDRLVG